ncbi:hypothetical protein KFU94_28580 [Chloroflexi bacterium TSY]|nr:hypothetical protein [Chloroflexi bacterium TSY]
MKALKKMIDSFGSTSRELIIDQKVFIAENETIEIPANLAVRVTREGKIVFPPKSRTTCQLNGIPQLTIAGSLEAGLYPIFQFCDSNEVDNDLDNVLFKRGSVKEVPTCWFGAQPDDPQQFDSQPAIQRAVYAALEVSRLYMPAGEYWINETIHLESPGTSATSSYVLEGSRPAMGAANPATIIHARFKDRPAINLSQARDTQIKNLSIVGQNIKASQVVGHPKKKLDKFDGERWADNLHPSDWISEGCTVGQHNPYCAIATDAYGSRPANRQDWYGDESRYQTRNRSNSGSSQVLIEGVDIRQFVVGIAVSPTGVFPNDRIRVQRSTIESCAYGIAVGTPAARGLHFQDNRFARCYTAIDNFTFGARSGSKINCTSNLYDACRNLYHLETTTGGAAHLCGEFATNSINLGNFGGAGNTALGSNMVFSGCQYEFRARVKTMHLLPTRGALTFIGCDFITWGDEERSKDFHVRLESFGANLVFQSCNFHTIGAEYPRFLFSRYADWNRIHFHDCNLRRIDGDQTAVEFLLSDDQVVDLHIVNHATRIPLHLNSQTLRVRSTEWPYRVYHLKYNSMVQPFLPGRTAERIDPYTIRFMIEQSAEGSFFPGDRLYCLCSLEEYPTPPESSLPMPLLEVESVSEIERDGDSKMLITAHIPGDLRQEVKLPEDFASDQKPIELQLLPRSENAPYVILNGESKGQFVVGTDRVMGVSNAGLLNIGDLVNGEFVPRGTRIKKIEEDTIYLSQKATKSSTSQDGDHVPIVVAKEV